MGWIEHLVFDDIPGQMAIINDPNARKEEITDPMPQIVEGKNASIVKVNAPVINRRTNEVVGRVGMNVNTVHLQAIVDDTIKNHYDIAAMAVYSNNGTIIAGSVPEQIGKLLVDGQKPLFGENTGAAQNAMLRGEKRRFSEYSQALRQELEIIEAVPKLQFLEQAQSSIPLPSAKPG
jgi:hypothetical protein